MTTMRKKTKIKKNPPHLNLRLWQLRINIRPERQRVVARSRRLKRARVSERMKGVLWWTIKAKKANQIRSMILKTRRRYWRPWKRPN